MAVLGGARWVASQPFTKIIIDMEPCMTMLLERKKEPVEDYCVCLQDIFTDEPWLLWVSGATMWATRNSQAFRSNMPSVNSAHISYSYRGWTNSTNQGTVVSLP